MQNIQIFYGDPVMFVATWFLRYAYVNYGKSLFTNIQKQ